jgi:predicted transcriptional regulator with HTH domain
MNSRYKDNASLIGLNIVEQVDTRKNLKVYKLTDFGKEIIVSMKNRR